MSHKWLAALVFVCVGAGLLVGVDGAQAASPGVSETQILSVSDEMPPMSGNEASQNPSISLDGNYVVFESSATNLGGIPNAGAHRFQVYLRDIRAGTTTMVSSVGGVAGDGYSTDAVISGDGSAVAFVSESTNLVSTARSGIRQALVWSRTTGELIHASLSNDPVPNPANHGVLTVDISTDGKHVAFATTATNLVGLPTFGVNQVYERDLDARVTDLVSVDTTHVPRTGSALDAYFPSISRDGQMVSFESKASLTSVNSGGTSQVYLRNVKADVTTLVSVDPAGTMAGLGESSAPSLSGDGQTVAFVSVASNLSPQPSGGASQVLVRDLAAKTTTSVSVSVSGDSAGNAASYYPVLSDDGNVVAFSSSATDLVPGPLASNQLYVRDLSEMHTQLVCSASDDTRRCNGSLGRVALSGNGVFMAFSTNSTNVVAGVKTADSQVYLRDGDVSTIDRIGGADRFDVSAGIAYDSFGTGVPVAYIASGAGFADALSGSAAAGAQRGPVLLVTKDTVPTRVGIELHRLNPKRIVVLGGTESVSRDVELALAAYSPKVARISGADRFEVSANLSAAVFSMTGVHPPVYIASGSVFPDALSGSAAAGHSAGPVLLVTKDAVPAVVTTELARLTPSKIIVLGGSDTIADSVVAKLGTFAPTSRIGGADRFVVSASISANTFSNNAETIYVASGAVFPDALSGSAAAIQNRGPVLLVRTDQIPPAVAAELRRLNPTRIVVLGGPNTLSDSVMTALGAFLRHV